MLQFCIIHRRHFYCHLPFEYSCFTKLQMGFSMAPRGLNVVLLCLYVAILCSSLMILIKRGNAQNAKRARSSFSTLTEHIGGALITCARVFKHTTTANCRLNPGRLQIVFIAQSGINDYTFCQLWLSSNRHQQPR